MKTSPLSKLILGTVQFGLEYGINNQNGKLSSSEVFQILKFSQEKNIKTLDCASHYGNASELIGEFHKTETRFDCYSKIVLETENNERALIENELERLSCTSLEGIYLHRFTDLEKCNWQTIASCKADGLIKKFGVSIYSLKEFKNVLNNPQIDLIQTPYNILDCSDEKGKLIHEANKLGKSVIARSIFLQGLFFKEITKFPKALRPLAPLVSHINKFLEKEKISSEVLYLGHALLNSHLGGVIFGVDSLSHLIHDLEILETVSDWQKLADNISILKNELHDLKSKIDSKKFSRLIDPSLWGNLGKNRDSQWPDALYIEEANLPSLAKFSTREDKISKLENEFSEKFQAYAVITPSARSGIASILRFLKTTRSQNIFLPPYSSNCLYEAVTSIIAPTSLWTPEKTDVALVVHKWGKLYSLSDFSGVIIEDSADRIPKDLNDILHNKGIAEVFSFPKMIGSFGGGLVLTRNQKLYQNLKMAQNDSEKNEYAKIQSELKKKNYFSEINPWEYWGHTETGNTYVDLDLISEIDFKSPLLKTNQTIIETRFKMIKNFVPSILETTGPVAVLPLALFSENKLDQLKNCFMVRQFSFNTKFDEMEFVPSVVIPLHMTCTDEEFSEHINLLKEVL